MLRHIEGLFVDLYLHAMVNDLLKRARALSSGALRSEQRSPGENPPSASVGRSMQPGRVDARVSDDEDGGGGPQPQSGDQQWPTRGAGSAGGPTATVGKSRQQKRAKRAEADGPRTAAAKGKSAAAGAAARAQRPQEIVDGGGAAGEGCPAATGERAGGEHEATVRAHRLLQICPGKGLFLMQGTLLGIGKGRPSPPCVRGEVTHTAAASFLVINQ